MFNKKILCIGNNSQDTDDRVSQLAKDNNTVNHGLISTDDFIASSLGYYQTTVVDLPTGAIVILAPQFDKVILLDQPRDVWSHWKILLSSYKLLTILEKLGLCVEYKNNQNIQSYLEFENLLENNKSFCIYPWIEKIEHGGKLTPCARSTYTITTLNDLTEWNNDRAYRQFRSTMLKGDRIPDACKVCYDQEDQGIESYRTFETREWISKLGIETIADLEKIQHPYYYEVRLNNKCNIACRGCRPEFSSKIEQEYKTFGITYSGDQTWDYSSLDIIDKENLTSDVRVYLTGGEPTVMVDVYKFMQECITINKTDFDFTIGTNAVALSKKFLDLAEHFTNLNFSISLDGYGKVNDYWRWGSEWNTVIANMHELQNRRHNISINCVPGIYNVTNLHLLFEFLDNHFPLAGFYLQLNYNDIHSVFNHPDATAVIESMNRCRNTKMYHTDGKSVSTIIDSVYNHYSNNPQCDLAALRRFFEYNDQQDRARNVKLADYIPELEACRKYI